MSEKIELINIDKKILNYSKKLNVDLSTYTKIEQGNIFFANVINDFKDGKNTLDELSVFGHYIFHKIAKKYPDSDLFNATLSASELNFAIRSSATFENIQMYLGDIEDFYKKFYKKTVSR